MDIGTRGIIPERICKHIDPNLSKNVNHLDYRVSMYTNDDV